MGFLALTFLLLHKLYQQPVLAHQIMPFFLVLGLTGVPAALLFSFLALLEFQQPCFFHFWVLLEFQQPHFFHFQPCWSSSSPIFFIFSLAGVPAAPFFSFLALLEFQQPHFFHFQPCWSSSSPTLSSSVAFTGTKRGRGFRRPFRAAWSDYFLGLAGKRNVSWSMTSEWSLVSMRKFCSISWSKPARTSTMSA